MSVDNCGFEVTMHLWIEDATSGHTLSFPQVKTYVIQPPPWCHDDQVALEMHLAHLTKLQYLFEMRRATQTTGPLAVKLENRQDYVVRGSMKEYLYPCDSTGQRKKVAFDANHLRLI